MSLDDFVDKLIKKSILPFSLVSSLLILFNISFNTLISSETKKNRMKKVNYVNSNFPCILSEIENRHDITLDDVNFTFSKEIPPRLIAYYSPETDSIYYSIDRDCLFLEKPQKGISEIFFSVLNEFSLKGVIIHEIGHDYTFQVYSSLEEKNEIHPSHKIQDDYFPTCTRDILIKEGIAEYFAISSGEYKRRENYKVWPTSIGKFYGLAYSRDTQLYTLGYDLVKPILDELGVEEGISSIYRNPIISHNELLCPDLYQKRIIRRD